MPAQFFDSKFVCQSEGREVTRVKKSGTLTVNLNVVTKGTTRCSLSVGDSVTSAVYY